MNSLLHRAVLPGIISSFLWATAAACVYRSGLLDEARLYWLDALFTAREKAGASPAPHPDVVIVGVDEKTLDAIREERGAAADDRLVTRTIIARLLAALGKAGSRTVAVDFLLDRPVDEKTDGDIEAVLSGNHPDVPGGLDAVLGCHVTLAEEKIPIPRFQRWAAMGNLLMTADPDGKYRTALPGYIVDPADITGDESLRELYTLEERAILPFATQACRVHAGAPDGETGSRLGAPCRIVSVDGAVKAVAVDGAFRVPAEILIDFAGPARTFEITGQFHSAIDVMRNAVDPALLRDKLVIIGPALRFDDRFAVGLTRSGDTEAYRRFVERRHGDRLDTIRSRHGRKVDLQRGSSMSGSEIHANVMSQILSGRHLLRLREYDPAVAVAGIVLPLLMLGWVFWHVWIGASGKQVLAWIGVQAGTFLVVAGGAVGLILWLFIGEHRVYLPLEFFAAWGGQALTGLVYTGVRLRRHNRKVEQMFGTAVGHELLAHIKKNPAMLTRHTRRTGTVLFADIRGFTAMAEQRGVEETIGMLAEYFDAMWKPLSENGAWVDKYAGDLVMAAWNVLEQVDDHVISVIRAAIGMKKALAALNERRAARGEPPIRNGIGIHTGEVIAGNVGSAERSNFTLIGDTVNLASRIEHAARNAEILVSEETHRHIAGRVETRAWGTIPIRGKSGEYTLHEVVWEE